MYAYPDGCNKAFIPLTDPICDIKNSESGEPSKEAKINIPLRKRFCNDSLIDN
jgi:hypothetical protein